MSNLGGYFGEEQEILHGVFSWIAYWPQGENIYYIVETRQNLDQGYSNITNEGQIGFLCLQMQYLQ